MLQPYVLVMHLVLGVQIMAPKLTLGSDNTWKHCNVIQQQRSPQCTFIFFIFILFKFYVTILSWERSPAFFTILNYKHNSSSHGHSSCDLQCDSWHLSCKISWFGWQIIKRVMIHHDVRLGRSNIILRSIHTLASPIVRYIITLFLEGFKNHVWDLNIVETPAFAYVTSF